MTRIISPAHHPVEQAGKTADAMDWSVLYPADAELMVAVEGDTKGLDKLKDAARARYTVSASQ